MLRYLITVTATPTGIPATAPKASPYPRLPAAQPIKVPTRITAAVNPMSTLPAPARENVGRWGSTGAEHTKVCDTGFGLVKRGMVSFVTRLVLVHGSVTSAAFSWRRQRELASEYELVTPNRPGFPPGPSVERVDFEAEVPWLRGLVQPGDHLVGHSYGAVTALLAAPDLPLASLTVIEPPAFAVARGVPEVEAWLEQVFALPRDDVRSYVNAFLSHVGAPVGLPDPMPADLARGAEAFVTERPPSEAEIPLAPLPYPVLVVSGAHEPAFDAVADVLERELRAERAVLPGAGHAVQSAPGFNDTLRSFLLRVPKDLRNA
jgi:pimeloyl-ACP methyl ester carboxylesterase